MAGTLSYIPVTKVAEVKITARFEILVVSIWSVPGQDCLDNSRTSFTV